MPIAKAKMDINISETPKKLARYIVALIDSWPPNGNRIIPIKKRITSVLILDLVLFGISRLVLPDLN